MIRLPAVSGRFYSASEATLWADIARHVPETSTPGHAIAAIAPHAGLMYSGRVAGAVYADLLLPPTVILIGPNHTGVGPPVSIFPDGRWVIPGAEVSIDAELTAKLLHRFPEGQLDRSAHQLEHCLELQLPFLIHGWRRQKSQPGRIVAVVLGTTEPRLCHRLGVAVADMIAQCAQDRRAVTVIASTDMNHYESDDRTRYKDDLAIAAIRALDPQALYQQVSAHHISMCGIGAVLTTLTTARILGSSAAVLQRYATSGEISGDYDRVVGYAGFVIL
jgi:AmmeMemoRadiSam system protein B